MKSTKFKRTRLITPVLVCAVMGAAWLMVSTQVYGQQEKPADQWADWKFLIGEWVTDQGIANNGSGSFSLLPDLQGKVLVRKNHAEYPAANGRPASTHDDLMVVYHDAAQNTRASYYDSEGHVISYDVALSANKDSLVMVSAIDAQTPRFRLTYSKAENERIKISFAIAPPGKPEAFSTYLEGLVHRK